MPDYKSRRGHMVDVQLARRGIRDAGVLDAMRTVPRERFVPEDMAEFAYEDSPLPIGERQTISQPYIVAAMIEAAEVRPGNRVLEVGAGSGYAVAVMAQITDRICGIERHESLAASAKQRLAELGYDQVKIVTGDGTRGLPEQAPFDAILVAAGAPAVPDALKAQLAVGGRLVIPVGGEERSQSLRKIVRKTETDYEETDFGRVMFVPLIGEGGWADDQHSAAGHQPKPSPEKSLPEMIAEAGEELPAFDDPAFGRLFERFADRRVVLLGEASHGTAEFYRARAAITRHLIEHHGYTIVAVEADWPDAAVVDRYVRHRPTPGGDHEKPFRRFPTWMWRNTEIQALIAWMHAHNAEIRDPKQRAGFYGLDIYNMSGSIGAVLDYLDTVDPAAAQVARERYGCLTPWQNDPATYGRAAFRRGYAECEQAVIAQCQALLQKQLDYAKSDSDAFHDAAQNARLVASAERYYRVMYYGGAESWNLRDTHMFETLQHLLQTKGPDAKAIVWAHNSHIGDARFTDMGATRNELNIGQLCRQEYGREAALIGFGTHTGTVAAATDWDGDMEIKQVNPSLADSYERLFHEAGKPRFLLDLSPGKHEALRRRLSKPRLERFIGVIYRPETERWSHYSQAILPDQFDAYVWFDETRAVTPLGPEPHGSTPDTYPFGE